MADNVGYTPGVGASVAADDIGGNLYQRVKIVTGADGVNDGDVSSANPMPVSAQSLLVMQRIAALLKPLQQITGGGSNRLSIDVNAVTTVTTVSTVTAVGTVTTVTGVTTVSTVTTLSNLGTTSDPSPVLARGSNLSAWADCVRALISP
jgi:hypothetical protein